MDRQTRIWLENIERKLDLVLRGEIVIMATQKELLQLISDANEETTLIGEELQTLLDAQGASGGGPIPQNVEDGMRALVDRLKGVAAEQPTPSTSDQMPEPQTPTPDQPPSEGSGETFPPASEQPA